MSTVICTLFCGKLCATFRVPFSALCGIIIKRNMFGLGFGMWKSEINPTVQRYYFAFLFRQWRASVSREIAAIKICHSERSKESFSPRNVAKILRHSVPQNDMFLSPRSASIPATV